jgi:hypothetical protein
MTPQEKESRAIRAGLVAIAQDILAALVFGAGLVALLFLS